jgi:hypothetical protein
VQYTKPDVYLNGAAADARLNFRRAAKKESGILKDDVETDPIRRAASVGGNLAEGDPS